ncbi:MAG: DUF72 domain-containing protein [Proteobacteria bacterium]|nr:DUF72 domain-containing protein [Pseudomonadota bacterium]
MASSTPPERDLPIGWPCTRAPSRSSKSTAPSTALHAPRKLTGGFHKPQTRFGSPQRCPGPPSLRVAVEFRHPSWIEAPDVEARLREARVAWIWNDWEPGPNPWAAMPRAIDEPRALRETADFAYLRLTGDHDITIDYQTITIDRGADLRRWAELISKWRENQMKNGRTGDVFVLLNNHYSGSSPRSASALRQLLDLPPVQFGAEPEWSPPTSSASLPMRLPGF